MCAFQHEAVSNMRKAKSLYISRHQEYDKIKEQALRAESELATQSTGGSLTVSRTDQKMEKRKKQEDEALQKVSSSICMIHCQRLY